MRPDARANARGSAPSSPSGTRATAAWKPTSDPRAASRVANALQRRRGPTTAQSAGAVDRGERQTAPGSERRAASASPSGPPASRRRGIAASAARARRPGAARPRASNTPARQAATYSPMLWPIIACGSTPHDCHSRASAYSTANSAGCVSAGRGEPRVGRLRVGPAGYSTSRRSTPSVRHERPSRRRRRLRGRPARSSYSSRAHARRTARPDRGTGTPTAAARRPIAPARRPARPSSVRSAPSRLARASLATTAAAVRERAAGRRCSV